MLHSSGDGQRLFCQKCQTFVAFLQKLNCTNTFENREEWNCNVLIWCRKRCCIPQGMVNDSFVKTSGPRKRKLPKLYIPSTLNIDLILWHNWLCVLKMLNHGLNHGFFLSLFKLITYPIHWFVCVLAYLNFIIEF